MTNDPGDRPDQGGDNPFKGTPFEQMFAAFGGGPGGAGMPDLSALMSQMQAMMQPHEGAVNWKLAKDIARRTTAETADPSATSGDQAIPRNPGPTLPPPIATNGGISNSGRWSASSRATTAP